MTGIRVDANEEIAMGHVMRCLSIALQLSVKEEVIFLLSEPYAEKLIEDTGFRCICLHNSYKEKKKELPELRVIIREQGIDRMLLDSYEVSEEYMMEIRQWVKLAYIDDLNRFRCPADLIINYTYGIDAKDYKGRTEHWQSLLLGSRYVPLRPEFAKEKIVVGGQVKSVFLTTGGTDSYHMITGILERMQRGRAARLEKYVVIGPFYRDYARLEQLSSEDKRLIIYQNIPDIAGIMRKSDIAISAGGTTLAELASCGVPTICFAMADNQLPGTGAYAADGIMLYAGDVRDNREAVLDTIEDFLDRLESRRLRQQLNVKGKEAIDGAGAQRIAEAIIKMI